MSYWLIFVWSDVEPEIRGPFDTEETRDQAAKELRREEGEDHGIFMLDITDDVPTPVVSSYCGGFFDQDEESEETG